MGGLYGWPSEVSTTENDEIDIFRVRPRDGRPTLPELYIARARDGCHSGSPPADAGTLRPAFWPVEKRRRRGAAPRVRATTRRGLVSPQCLRTKVRVERLTRVPRRATASD